jgi:hypothetical protein
VKQINLILKDHSYNVEAPPSYPYRHYRQIVVDKNAKFTLMDFRETRDAHKFHDKTVFCITNLRDLEMGDSKDLPDDKFSIFINCKNGKACVLEPETAMLNASKDKWIDFQFDDKDSREKFRVEFGQLLKN